MYNQSGGNVIWHNNSSNSTWKELPGQEYSVLEKNLLIKLNAIPNITSVVTRGRFKGRVKKLDTWWNNPYTIYPMTTSFHDLIKDKSFDYIAQISLDLSEIIIRRQQDRDKLIELTGDKAHENYLNSLINAREYVRNLLTEITRKKHSTTEHIRSPVRIDSKISPEESTRLSHHDTGNHHDTGKLSYLAPEFVPGNTLSISNNFIPTQQFHYPHLHPSFDSSLYDLFYDPSCNCYYWLNKVTNEVIYVNSYF